MKNADADNIIAAKPDLEITVILTATMIGFALCVDVEWEYAAFPWPRHVPTTRPERQSLHTA